MKVQITGITGFVGTNLSKYLQNNNFMVKPLPLRGNWDKEFDKDSDAIIHLAGKAHDTSNTSEPAEYFKINAELTFKVFNAFLNSEVKDFIYFSSVKAVADTVENILFETAIPLPQTPYGKSKLSAEEYILSKKLQVGKRVFIIRPCMIHGPGNKGNLNLLYNVVKKGIPYPLASFDNRRSFLSIDNLNFLIHQILICKSIPSGIYNFSDDAAISTNQIVRMIGEVSGIRTRLWHIPKFLINAVAVMGDTFGIAFNSERVKKLTENYVVSNQKIKEALGVEKLPTSSGDGFSKTIKSFLV